jgi:hypothetical protein
MRISTEQAFAEQVIEKTEYRVAEQAVDEYIFVSNINPAREQSEEAFVDNLTGRSTGTPELVMEFPRVLRKPHVTGKPQHRFRVLQKFEGTVLEISGQECRAVVRDLTSPGYVEEITFSIEEISESDRSLAVPGGIFYWSLGYDDHVEGQRYRSSAIIFRRIPAWREKDLIKAKKKAESLIKRLGWKREDSSFQR